jgi:hypothetical protein
MDSQQLMGYGALLFIATLSLLVSDKLLSAGVTITPGIRVVPAQHVGVYYRAGKLLNATSMPGMHLY